MATDIELCQQFFMKISAFLPQNENFDKSADDNPKNENFDRSADDQSLKDLFMKVMFVVKL